MNSDYPLVKSLNYFAALKFVTQVREIVKNENEPCEYWKAASVAQNIKLGTQVIKNIIVIINCKQSPNQSVSLTVI